MFRSLISLASAGPRASHFCVNFGITKTAFDKAFDDRGKGVYQLKPGWSLPFTHAVLTTGDRAKTFPDPEGIGRAAGELWKQSTGKPVTQEKCCVFNCTNENCKPGSRQPAGATAHVYCTTQKPQQDIRYMALIPTCSGCNHSGKVAKTKTGYPATGEKSKILYTETEARMIFIEVSDQTVGKKGDGKGSGSRQGKAAAEASAASEPEKSAQGQGKGTGSPASSSTAPAKATAKKPETPAQGQGKGSRTGQGKAAAQAQGRTSYSTGEGGEYDGDYPPGRPEGAHIVGECKDEEKKIE